MNILIVSPYLPHPRALHGTGVFMHGLLVQLTQHHRVTLVCFCDDKESLLAPDLAALPLELHLIPRAKGRQASFAANALLALWRFVQLARSIILWRPYYTSKFTARRMARLVDRLTARQGFDIVQCEFAQMGQYRKHVRAGATILHEHDVTFRPAYRRFKKASRPIWKAFLFLEWCRWARYEPALAAQYDHVLTVTEQDTRLLKRLSHTNNISYLPRGVDLPERIPRYEQRESKSLIFVGTFAHHPNVDSVLWLVRDIFPLVLRKYPATILYIIGSDPPQALRDLAVEMPGVRILGYVEDVIPYLRECAVFVAPLRFGGGVKLKIIHAMAQGIPVVTTPVGVEGIEGIDHDRVLLANTPRTIAEGICALLGDPSLGARIGERGFELVRQHYSWKSTTLRLEEIYRTVKSQHAR